MKKFSSKTQKIGEIGEDLVCKYLINKGFSILERNYTKKWGEIDIIAKKDGVLHFIEVKAGVSYEIKPNITPKTEKKLDGYVAHETEKQLDGYVTHETEKRLGNDVTHETTKKSDSYVAHETEKHLDGYVTHETEKRLGNDVTHETTKQLDNYASHETKSQKMKKVTHETYDPLENIHSWKLKRFLRTLETYLAEKSIDLPWQIDVAIVKLNLSKRVGRVKMIDNVTQD